MTGTTYTVAPIPPDAENTTYVAAGSLRIGVEYRLLDNAGLAANYEGADMEEIQVAVGENDIEDNGVSIHVLGAEDEHEYLRFDMFAREPHYHYIHPSGEQQTIMEFDRVALGEMLPWVLAQLSEGGRLVEMLKRAGGEALVPRLDRSAIAASLAEVKKLAREAEAVLAAQSNGSGGGR
jgi:hypothetical protein